MPRLLGLTLAERCYPLQGERGITANFGSRVASADRGHDRGNAEAVLQLRGLVPGRDAITDFLEDTLSDTTANAANVKMATAVVAK